MTTPQPPLPSDGALAQAACGGDGHAFGQLVERHFAMVYAIAYARLGQAESAEDLAQEVFLRAYLFLHTLSDRERFAGWLSRIARNAALNWLAARQRRSRLVSMVALEDCADDALRSPAKGASERMSDNEEAAAVRQALTRLPVEEREIVVLHFFEGLSQETIAERLEMHQATVSRRLRRSLRRMKGLIEPVLRGAAPAFRAPQGAAARAMLSVAAAAALSAPAKAALAAAAGGGAVAGAAATGIVWQAASAWHTVVSGGFLMSIKTQVAAVVAALALIGGVTYHELAKTAPVPTAPVAAAVAPTEKQRNGALLATIRDQVRSNETRLSALKMEYTCRYTTTSQGAAVNTGPQQISWGRIAGEPYSYWVATWAQKDAKYYKAIDYYGATGNPVSDSVSAFDGQTRKSWSRKSNQGTISDGASDSTAISRRADALDLLALGLKSFEGDTLPSEALVPKYASLKGTETVDGREAYVVDVTQSEQPVYHARMWIDRERAVPIRIRHFDAPASSFGAQLLVTVEGIRMLQLPNGGWMPVEGTRTVYFPNRVPRPLHIRVDAESISVRPEDVPDSLFDIQFPSNAKVTNMTAQVSRQGNNVTILGLEEEVWGSDSPRQMSVIAAMDAALRVMGEDVSYDYLMGVSGGAFRIQFNWSPAAACAPCGFDCYKAAADATGYSVRQILTRRHGSNELVDAGIAEARQALVASLERGIPALADSEECGLIVGYIEGGQNFVHRPYSPQGPGYPQMDKWPWSVDILEKKDPAPERVAVIRRSLETAASLWYTAKQDEFWCGRAAYEHWAADLRSDATFTSMTSQNWFGKAIGNGYCYGTLYNARRCAAAYLRTVAPELPAPMRPHLERAAERYDALAERLNAGLPGAPHAWALQPWALGSLDNWTKELREAQADRLLEVQAIDGEAVAEIEAALQAQ